MKTLIIPLKLMLFSLFLLFLTGCWDQSEVEQLSYVVAIGLDKPEDIKEEGLIEITYLITNPQAATKDGGGEPPREIISFTVNDFINARNMANTVISKKISYDLLRLIVVSEKFAKDDDFIRWMYDATKAVQFRRDLRFLVTKESPSAFIQNSQPIVDTRPHKYFELIFKRGEETGTTPPGRLNNYYRITESDANLFLGIYATTEQSEREEKEDVDQIIAGEFDSKGETNTTQFAGSAVFKEGKMIDTLTIEETRLSTLLSSIVTEPDELLTAMPDPFNDDYQLTISIQKDGDVDMNFDLKRKEPTIDVTLPLVIEVMTDHSLTNYSTDKKKREELRTSLEKTLTQKLEELIKKTQEEFGAEPFGWALLARKEFLTIPEYEKFNWMKTYPEMKVNVDVNLRIDNFGRQTKLPDLDEVRD